MEEQPSSPADPRRLYSWWWDSHIVPKNSKWLMENLTDIDSKIKAMIKIIELDADSFARKAEMYYRKRPELMKLVEEFYRTYRALAERYDHQAGELRHAHRTMAQAFPDQISFEFDDDLPPETAAAEPDPKDLDGTSQFFLTFLGSGDHGKLDKGNPESPAVVIDKLHKEIGSLSMENQELKNNASLHAELRAKAESEVSRLESEVLELKEAVAGLEMEKEQALLQCQQSGARLSSLKADVVRTQEEFEMFKERMKAVINGVNNAEEQRAILESANSSLRCAVDELKHKVKALEDELNEKNVEIEKLSVSLQEEHLRNIQAEMSRLSLEKQLAESTEKMKRRNSGEAADMEETIVRLECELEMARDECRKLDEQNHTSSAKVIRLQEDIIGMKDVQRWLEDEVARRAEENKKLLDELAHVREDRVDTSRWHGVLSDQLQRVNCNVDSLRALTLEVRDGNAELKEIIKNQEGVRTLHIENTMQLERMSVVTAELEGLRGKKVELEESCKHLQSQIAGHRTERDALESQLKALSQTMDGILEKNMFLESSLSDANAELTALKGKMIDIKQFSDALSSENAALRIERITLSCEVESLGDTLMSMESRFAELEEEHSTLCGEKAQLLRQVSELQQTQRDTVDSSKKRFGRLERQIALLQEECRRRERQSAAEELSIVEAQTEIFVLRQCLTEMSLMRHEESRNAERLLLELRRRSAGHEEEIHCLSQHNKKLAKGVRSVLEALKLDLKYESLDKMRDEIIFQLVVHEIRCMMNSISDAQDVKQNQLLEKSLVVTLLEHFGREVADLRAERGFLKQETLAKRSEMAVLQSEKHELLKMNEELLKKMELNGRKVDDLKQQTKFLAGQLADVQESRRSLQSEIIKLLEENSKTSGRACREDDGGVVLEAVNSDILSVIFRSLHEERRLQLQSLQKNFGFLCAAGSDLYQEIKLMNEKLGVLDDDRRRIAAADSGSDSKRSVRRDMQLLSVGGEHRVQQCQDDRSGEGLQRANEMLKEELRKLRREVEALRRSEEEDAVKSCDAEIMKLLGNIKVAIMNAALFKEKVLELIITCESYEISSMVQKEVLKEEISRRNSYVDELKGKLSAVEVENRRLKVDLNGDFTVLGSLQHEVDALERQTLSLARDCFPMKKIYRKEESTGAPSPRMRSNLGQAAADGVQSPRSAKSVKMQKLHSTIKALQKVVTDTGELLEQERTDFTANLADARKQVEMLKLKEISDEDLSSEATYEHMLKDIQLDLVQSSSAENTGSGRVRSFRQQRFDRRNAVAGNGVDDKMLGFWGVVGAYSDNNSTDIEHPQVEAVEADKGKRPSAEMIIEKEICTDGGHQLVTAVEPCQEWTRRVVEKISSDTERITSLQSGVRELKKSVEAAEDSGGAAAAATSVDVESIKCEIRDAELAITQLAETNKKLSRKADEFTAAAAESELADVSDLRRSQRKIMERSRKVSEKIVRMELELQRMQQMVLKREEEMASKRAKAAASAAAQRRTRVLLVEYLYGRRRDSRKPKPKRGGTPCGCMRAKAQDD